MKKPEKPKTVKAVLVAARAILAKRGAWTQGEFRNADSTKFCAVGACRQAAGYWPGLNPRAFDLSFAAHRALAGVLSKGWVRDGVTGFNDAQSRKGPVLALFTRAIKACK